jgi:hypothetical protein
MTEIQNAAIADSGEGNDAMWTQITAQVPGIPMDKVRTETRDLSKTAAMGLEPARQDFRLNLTRYFRAFPYRRENAAFPRAVTYFIGLGHDSGNQVTQPVIINRADS